MAVWLVRAGKYGDAEQTAIDKGVVTIGWNELPDLSTIHDREAFADLYRKLHPDASGGKVANHAEQGLLVCWGGFKSSVIQEARQSFFTIRLWDSGDLLGMILKNHDKFSDDLKAELPLKRVWALVLEE